ncbi:hypothetical protein [Glutamicibacter halophytocola]|uniref:Uncharacterized protein n=1 Tax=Glutamicibacter halophytocola TaxID=1933880 RepID=A0AA94XVC8_9MICC|nr:hypothetical protein [Glutamicibacter halophytocola]ALG27968.1 hypothetical protein AOZ07_02405 [Glutamicibacter halophytocola]UUX59484.1 hypothetical protein NUH22_02250 [Glutamicibacter halophytocola]
MYENEEVVRDSPFATGPLTTKADVIVKRARWCNHIGMLSILVHRYPVDFEELFYVEIIGAVPGVAARELVT